MRFIPSPHHGEGLQPLYLVIHYTATRTLQGVVRWFQNPSASVSAHVIVTRTGEAVQMVPFDRRALHAGRSRWGALEDLNAYSIGLELVNAGALVRQRSGRWVDWRGNPVPDDEVIVARHKHESVERGWHAFPGVQIDRALRIAESLHERYRFRDVLGHDDVAPARKIDPGPAFPMAWFASRLLGVAMPHAEPGVSSP